MMRAAADSSNCSNRFNRKRAPFEYNAVVYTQPEETIEGRLMVYRSANIGHVRELAFDMHIHGGVLAFDTELSAVVL